MRDLRENLDSTMLAWLETLDTIMGQRAAVQVGYEGEPLHFHWAHRHSHFFEIMFHDNDHVDFHWISTLPLREWVDEKGEAQTEYPHHSYEETNRLTFGRIPRVMADEMKRFRVYLSATVSSHA